ncbi:hypothetical protein [Ruegeria sediminis]|nr:hypothetical protein [Ruegeria sediminis]
MMDTDMLGGLSASRNRAAACAQQKKAVHWKREKALNTWTPEFP